MSSGAIPYANKWQDRKDWTFGPIASMQNGKDGKPAWILSGTGLQILLIVQRINLTRPIQQSSTPSSVW